MCAICMCKTYIQFDVDPLKKCHALVGKQFRELHVYG